MPSDLTPREREIVLLAGEGRTDEQIARHLGVGRGTVITHWKRMRERTGAANRAQAVALELARAYREAETERVRSAGLYQALIETLEDFAVFMLDGERRLLSWNPGVGTILGYDEASWVGSTADIIFLPEDRAADAPLREQEEAMRHGRALDERWHVRQDGSRFWASGVMVPIRGDDGEILCFSKILRDLTRMKRLEERVASLGDDPAKV